MSAIQLIDLAKIAGIGIGRKAKGRYYWLASDGSKVSEHCFAGSYHEFVKFIKSKVNGG